MVGAFKRPAEIKCSACGWWPPMVRERRTGDSVRVVPASESWRWRALRSHIFDVAMHEDGDGPHLYLAEEVLR